MPSQQVTQVAKKIVSLLLKFPKDRIRHNATFRTAQIERFCSIGGFPVPKSIVEEKKQAEEQRKAATTIDTKKIKEVVWGNHDKPVNYQNDMFTEDILQQQYKSLKHIYEGKWANYYKIDAKLLTPKGNPNYYNRLLENMKEDGQAKESFLSAFKTIMTGKY